MSDDILNLRSADGACAAIHLHGGHVLAWTPAGEHDSRLYLSAVSKAAPGVAIRGGVPVIFPQFAGEGPLPKHGFARTARWSLLQQHQDESQASATLRLGSSAETLALWPYPFELHVRVALAGAQLAMTLTVENTGNAPMHFTAALHTYLRIGNLDAVSLGGLRGLRYRDSAAGGTLREEADERVQIAGEVDRIYFDAPASLMLRDGPRQSRLEQTGFTDTVVWNPGPAKAAALADLEQPDGYRRMLCIEAACIQKPVTLMAGGRWSGTQTLVAVAA